LTKQANDEDDFIKVSRIRMQSYNKKAQIHPNGYPKMQNSQSNKMGGG